jgi:hypothetical protein
VRQSSDAENVSFQELVARKLLPAVFSVRVGVADTSASAGRSSTRTRGIEPCATVPSFSGASVGMVHVRVVPERIVASAVITRSGEPYLSLR